MNTPLTELEALLEKATPGPWKRMADTHAPYEVDCVCDNEGRCIASMDSRGAMASPEEMNANGKLIIALRNAAPALIARIRGLEAERTWMDISTAPKDGTEILCCKKGFLPSQVRWVEYLGEAKWCIDPESFMEEEHFDEWWHGHSYEPDLWMPLPTPPQP